MAECTNQQLGMLLHAYEVGALSDADAERFELHLFECEHCLEKLKTFNAGAALLRHDADVKSVFRHASQSETLSLIARLRRRLWPEGPLLVKPALLYLLILLMVIPTILWLGPGEEPDFQEVSQTLELNPTRQGLEAANLRLSKSAGALGLLIFYYGVTQPGEECRIVITTEEGTTVYRNDHYDHFDLFKTGKLQINLKDLDTGLYRLRITDSSGDTLMAKQDYFFRIQE